MGSPTVLTIDLFSDITCPWCFIGSRRLEQALSSLDRPVEVTLTHRPFLLNPSTPPEGIDVAAMLTTKYGVADIRAIFAPAEAAARETGIPLDLSKQRRAYPTLAAHTLLRYADAEGVGRAVADALHSAHFLEARNISRPDVLVEIAAAYGLAADVAARMVEDEAELVITRQEADEAVALGLRGVPYFVFGDRLALSGAQPLETFRTSIQSALG